MFRTFGGVGLGGSGLCAWRLGPWKRLLSGFEPCEFAWVGIWDYHKTLKGGAYDETALGKGVHLSLGKIFHSICSELQGFLFGGFATVYKFRPYPLLTVPKCCLT